MKFYSEHEVRKLIEETDIHDGIRGTTSEYLSIMKGIELPDKHGRIVDLDKVLDWLIKEDGRFSMATSAKIDNALKNAPVILKASEEREEQKRVCGNCKWCHEGHYEEEGEEPYIKRKCLNKHGLAKGYSVYSDDFCSRWEESNG